jgi:uncharacterized membrane protein
MTTVEESIEVEVPVSTAYNQWTQFEDFPEFMEGVEKVEQLTDDKLHWVTKIAGAEREFDAKITEQHPDERVAWTTMDGPKQAGVVTFHKLDPSRTKVMLQLDFEPEGIVEQAGDKLGIVKSRVHGDLERFKTFIEKRGTETGAWRGDISSPAVVLAGG